MQTTFINLHVFCIISAADIEVKTSSGISSSYSNSGILNWDDIPYAKPPIGNLRWKAPREITNSEIFLLPKDNNFCVQRPSGMGGSEGEGTFLEQKTVFI